MINKFHFEQFCSVYTLAAQLRNTNVCRTLSGQRGFAIKPSKHIPLFYLYVSLRPTVEPPKYRKLFVKIFPIVYLVLAKGPEEIDLKYRPAPVEANASISSLWSMHVIL